VLYVINHFILQVVILNRKLALKSVVTNSGDLLEKRARNTPISRERERVRAPSVKKDLEPLQILRAENKNIAQRRVGPSEAKLNINVKDVARLFMPDEVKEENIVLDHVLINSW